MCPHQPTPPEHPSSSGEHPAHPLPPTPPPPPPPGAREPAYKRPNRHQIRGPGWIPRRRCAHTNRRRRSTRPARESTPLTPSPPPRPPPPPRAGGSLHISVQIVTKFVAQAGFPEGDVPTPTDAAVAHV